MARIVPSDLTDAYLAQSNLPEINTLLMLKKTLPADYTVFHSVHWSRSRPHGTSFGELDFVILNRSGEILVVEQKNGSLAESDAGLKKVYDDRERGIGEQIHRSLDGIRSKLKGILQTDNPIRLDYLLYCPDYRVRDVNAAGLDRDRIVDAAEKNNLSRFVESLLGPGTSGNNETAELVEDFFRHSFHVVPDLHSHISATERAFTRLSEGLAEVVACIEMKPLRLRIQGTAGCGKSHVALRVFREAIRRGRRPLLVCFNRPLKEKLAALAPKGGMVQTWYGLCDQFLTAAGQKPNFGNYQLSQSFWREVQDRVTVAPMLKDWIFDTLIVDEGQDFEDEWLQILRLFHAPDGDFIWLEDAAQNVFRKPPVNLPDVVTFHAKKNYRSPQSIARYIRKALPFEFEGMSHFEGLGVGIHLYTNPKEQIEYLNKVVLELLKRGFRYEDIAVLSFRGTGNSTFSNLPKIGSHTLKHFSGGYDMFGNQLFTDGKLLFETIGRFKGQQAAAVILTDIDPRADDLKRANHLLFCGMTRATVRLELLASERNPACRELVQALR